VCEIIFRHFVWKNAFCGNNYRPKCFWCIFAQLRWGDPQCSNYREGTGDFPHCGCGPHVIHGVEVSAPRCRPHYSFLIRHWSPTNGAFNKVLLTIFFVALNCTFHAKSDGNWRCGLYVHRRLLTAIRRKGSARKSARSSVLIRRTIHVERPPATLRIIADITTFGKLKKTHLPSVAFNVS